MAESILGMYVSIIVCTHLPDNYSNLVKAVESLLEQTHREKEIIVVIDGNPELYERVSADYRSQEEIIPVLLKENSGVSAARNAGIRVAKGDIIAFLDDDAFAEKDWLKQLISTYQRLDAIAVGGKILPTWIKGRPNYFPEELDWLVGVTDEVFAGDKVTEVRNTFGPNMSFKSEVFREIGLFSRIFGFVGTSFIQAEEPELALRMKRKFGKNVIYNPKAVVYHIISPSKLTVDRLLKRSFFQGYSKALIKKMGTSTDSLATEKSYLKHVLLKRIPYRLKRVYHLNELKKVVMLTTSIICVALGFVYGYLRKTNSSKILLPNTPDN
ncbi:MAG TPA: glycosyltransferase family 2 protein [Dehalococcoidales bacterium]